jgi:hypothetical protein
MDSLAPRLEELGAHLQRLPDPLVQSPHSERVAEQLSLLCRILYRRTLEFGDGGHPAYLYPNPPTETTVTEPRLDESAVVVPFLSNTSMRLADEMLQRSTLYSKLSLIVMPLSVTELELSYSAVGRIRRNYDEYRDLFEYNRRHYSLVSSGRCIFLPRRYTFDFESTSSWSRDDYAAPLMQYAADLTYLPGNLPQVTLGRSPYQDLFIYEKFLLPYFPDASLGDIAAISEKETDSFIVFNRYLTKQLARLSDPKSVDEWSDVMEDIRAEVARLKVEARKVARSKVLRNSQIAMFAVTVCAILGLHNASFDDLAGIFGSASLLQLLQTEIQKRNSFDDLRKSEFFIPYLLSSDRQARSGQTPRL